MFYSFSTETVCGKIKAVDPSAQTEPPGGCLAGECSAWSRGLTGRFFPLSVLYCQVQSPLVGAVGQAEQLKDAAEQLLPSITILGHYRVEGLNENLFHLAAIARRGAFIGNKPG